MKAPYGLGLTESCQDCKLRSENFFCNLPRSVLRAFEGIKFTSTYPQGAVLFVEGEAPRGIFILCQGRVKLSLNSSKGKTIILDIATPGDILGLNATLSGHAYEATAEVVQPSQVNFAKRENFLRFLNENREACLRATRTLSEHYQTACEQIRTLGLSSSASEKLARLLLGWAVRGDNTKQATRVKLALTHEEIAQIIGTSRETVTRILSEFKARHLASLQGSNLVIQDTTALENFVNS